MFYFPSEGSSFEHGERIYTHIDGHEFRVFVSESEEDGSSPINYQYWRDYFSSADVTRHVYNGVVDYCSEYNISSSDVDEVLLNAGPKLLTPKPIDHAAMRRFFC